MTDQEFVDCAPHERERTYEGYSGPEVVRAFAQAIGFAPEVPLELLPLEALLDEARALRRDADDPKRCLEVVRRHAIAPTLNRLIIAIHEATPEYTDEAIADEVMRLTHGLLSVDAAYVARVRLALCKP